MQDKDFRVTTQSFTIRQDEKGLAVLGRSKTGDNEETRGTLCAWPNGWLVSQFRDEVNGLYSYQRVTIAPNGYFAQDIVFDRSFLESMGVPFKLEPVGRQNLVEKMAFTPLRATILGDDEGAPEDQVSLVVDNSAATLATMVDAAHAVLASLAAVRE